MKNIILSSQLLDKKLEMQNYAIFFILENVFFFSPKIPVFSIPVHETGLKVENSDPLTKVRIQC